MLDTAPAPSDVLAEKGAERLTAEELYPAVVNYLRERYGETADSLRRFDVKCKRMMESESPYADFLSPNFSYCPSQEELVMKRFFTLFQTIITMMLLMAGLAYAEERLPAEVIAQLQSAYPSCSISLADQCGQTAAAVLWDGETQVLCLAEEQDGIWDLVVSNPAALRQNTPVTSLLLDTEETLYWSYNPYSAVTETCHAVRENGQWRVTGMMSSENNGNGTISESQLWYAAECLQYSTSYCDENENIMSHDEYTPVPAAWLKNHLPLSVYDDSRFPKPNNHFTHSWLSDEATALAAAELFPDALFLGGCAGSGHLAFFLQEPNGDRIIASCRFQQEDGWTITLSTPLPEGTIYGWENFSSSLIIGELLVSIGPVDDTTCGVTCIYNTAEEVPDERMFHLGKNWITNDVPNGYNHCYGDHPWGDIAVMDWSSLPHTFEEALTMLDSSGWAVVNNPNPSDRLHLRVQPERGALSLGKYYNGTPVRILDVKGEWVHADIFGVKGWMMKEYLALGDAGRAVEAVFPSRVAVEAQTDHFVYAEPVLGFPIANYQHTQHGLLVLGIVDEKWYHVWFPNDQLCGYVLQSEWWEGNG